MKKYSTSVSKLIRKEELYDFLGANLNAKKKMLVKFGFDIDTINFDDAEITLKISTDEEFVKLTPTVNMAYYDENDNLTMKVRKVPNRDDLVTFEGEIYENLKFNSPEEAKEFASMYGYGQHICEDTVALMHFRGLEWNNNKIEGVKSIKHSTESNNTTIGTKEYLILRSTLAKALEQKEIYIVKSKNFYTIYYNDVPVSKVNITKNGFSSLELEDIIKYLEHEVSDKGYFSLFARDSVETLKSNLMNRGYNPNKDFVSTKSQATYVETITNPSINSKENVYIKLKVVSNQPVVLIDSKLESRDPETEIDKKYYLKIK